MLLSGDKRPQYATPEILADVAAGMQEIDSTAITGDIVSVSRRGNRPSQAKRILFLLGDVDWCFPPAVVRRQIVEAGFADGQAELKVVPGPHNLHPFL